MFVLFLVTHSLYMRMVGESIPGLGQHQQAFVFYSCCSCSFRAVVSLLHPSMPLFYASFVSVLRKNAFLQQTCMSYLASASDGMKALCSLAMPVFLHVLTFKHVIWLGTAETLTWDQVLDPVSLRSVEPSNFHDGVNNCLFTWSYWWNVGFVYL